MSRKVPYKVIIRCDYRHVSGEKRRHFLDVYVAATVARESDRRVEILSCSAQGAARGTSQGYRRLPAISRQAGGHRETLATPAGGLRPPHTVVHKIADHQIGLSQAKSALTRQSASNGGGAGVHWRERYQCIVSGHSQLSLTMLNVKEKSFSSMHARNLSVFFSLVLSLSLLASKCLSKCSITWTTS